MTTTNLFTNRATAKIAADVASNDTAITLVAGGGALFPAPGVNEFFRLVLQKGTAATDQREYMTCTNVTGDVLTVSRGEEGTPAAAFTVGDEVSLVITAKSSSEFVQKQGVTLQGALEVEAAPTTPLGIANKAWVENGRVNDVPDDGNIYGREFGAWAALGDAASLPLPIPVDAGGTGGITVGEAQTNLVIGVTSIDDLEPTTKKYGDRWIKPSNMTELVWVPNQGTTGAGVWINPMDAQSEAYPIPINKGGTGATTIQQALINLGIADHDSLKVGVDATSIYVNIAAKAAGGHSIASLMKAGTGTAGIYGYGGTVAAPLARWFLQLGNGTAEAGSNAGSDFVVARYNDAGAVIDNPISISRATGLVNFSVGATAGTGRFGDGAVASPSIAFIAEPGLGFWRSGAGEIKLAQGGSTIWGVTGSGANVFSAFYPKTAGGRAVMSLTNFPFGTANGNQINIETSATAYTFGAQNVGTGTSKPFSFTGGSAYTFDNAGNFDFILSVIGRGNNSAQLVLNKGPNGENTINGMQDGVLLYRLIQGDASADRSMHWQSYTTAGVFQCTLMRFTKAEQKVFFDAPGGVQVVGGLTAANVFLTGTGYGLTQDATWRYLQFQSGYYFNWHIPTGNLYWSPGAGPQTMFGTNGDIHAGGNLWTGGPGQTNLGIVQNGSFPYVRFSADNWRLQFDRSTGNLAFRNPSNVPTIEVDGGGSVYIPGSFTIRNSNSFSTTGYHISQYFGSAPIYSNALDGSPGGMYQCLSMQHTPGTYAAIQLQVGGNNFTFNSNGTANAAGAWVDSDSRGKVNITTYTAGAVGAAIAAVMAIPVKEWDRPTPDPATGQVLHQVGWVAQDVQAHFPKAVYEVFKTHVVAPATEGAESTVVDDGLRLTLDHGAMTAILWKAVQEIVTRLKQLEHP